MTVATPTSSQRVRHMPLLRRASTAPKKIELDNEGSYIEVSEDITRRQFNKLADALPSNIGDDTFTPAQGVGIQGVLFETFVIGWSLDSEPTIEEYESLPQEAATAIDDALMKHFGEVQVGEPDQKKPKQSSRTEAKG